MRRTIKDIEYELKVMKSQRDDWRDKYYKSEEDKKILTDWIKNKFNWWIELISDSKSPCLKYLIKNTAMILGMKY